MYRILIYDSQGNLASNIVLSRDPITLGRDPSCDLPLSDVNISRKHARIEPMGRFYVLNDLKSTNGTWVNQNPVRTHLLKHGDVIRVGNFRLVVQVIGEPSAPSGEVDLDREGCHTKIIEDPFAYDTSPGSPHTLRINVGKEKVEFPAGEGPSKRLLKLHDISCRLGIIETPTVLCGQAVEIILEELDADRACLLVPQGEELCTVAARVAESQKGRPFNIHHGVLRSAIDDLTAILTEDAAQDQRFRSDGEKPGGRVRSVMCVPMVAQTNLQGAIYADRTTNPLPFTEDDLRFLAVIGNQIAINLANARLFEDVLLEKQKVQAVVASLKDGLVITDQNLAIQSNNLAAAQIFQERGGFLEDRNLLELLLDRDCSLEEGELRGAIREGGDFRLLFQRGSEVRAYDASVAPFSPGDEGQGGYVFSFRDTTDLHHLQELKSEFIRNASHKLRTPLTVILGSLDILRSLPADEELGANRAILISGMEKNLQHLQSLVTRFLEFAELDRNRFKLRELDLRELVAVTVNGISPKAMEKEIAIHNKIPRDQVLQVQGDGDRLVQCLHNIIENAVKFTPEKTAIRIRSEVGEEMIRIHVEDEGPGIPQEDLLDIFSGFHQVEKIPTGEVPGAGLGLTIAKRIIHAHHGSITAMSPVPETGKGTVITISLPRPQAKEPNQVASPEAVQVS